MIDIHTHIIPKIDDGSNAIENSIKMVEKAYQEGITHIICTPHYRYPYLLDYKSVKTAFDSFVQIVQDRNIPVKLYLGREVCLIKNIENIVQEDNYRLANSKYILIEQSSIYSCEISEVVFELKLKGFIPILAHVERYSNFSFDDVIEIKNLGGLVQVNADSLVGVNKWVCGRFAKKLLKERLVDFVASDIHSSRRYVMKKAYNYVAKKFGKEYADKIFILNAKKIIKEK